MKFQVSYFDELESTSQTLLKLSGTDEFHCKVICAHLQTKGRGRKNRTWQTNAGNLAFSIGFRIPKQDLALTHYLPLWLSVAVFDAIAEYLTPEAEEALTIKWPNDLVWNEQKIMGVLSQAREQDGFRYLSVGVGINVNWAPEELPAVALSALPLNQDCPEKKVLLEKVLANLSAYEQDWSNFSKVKQEWELRSRFIGKDIYYGVLEDEANMSKAKAVALAESGSLIVEGSDGVKELMSEDLSLRLSVRYLAHDE